jgi:hypothetical protein
MPRGIGYDQPSRLSLVLIAGFSTTLFVMAGWLVLMIMFAPEANTTTADASDIVVPEAAAPPSAPVQNRTVRVVTARVSPRADDQTDRLPNAGALAASPWPVGPAAVPETDSATPSPAAAPAADPAPAPTAGAVPSAPTAYATAALPSQDPNFPSATEAVDRVSPADLSPTPEAAEGESLDVVPLPKPRPRHLASIPMPRPRPQINEPQQEKSLFEVLFGSR